MSAARKLASPPIAAVTAYLSGRRRWQRSTDSTGPLSPDAVLCTNLLPCRRTRRVLCTNLLPCRRTRGVLCANLLPCRRTRRVSSPLLGPETTRPAAPYRADVAAAGDVFGSDGEVAGRAAGMPEDPAVPRACPHAQEGRRLGWKSTRADRAGISVTVSSVRMGDV